MDDAQIIRLYMQRDERALQETKAQYEALCMTGKRGLGGENLRGKGE